MKKKMFTNKEKVDIIDLYKEGFSCFELGKEYKCHKNVIRNRLKEWGIKLRNHKESMNTERHKKIVSKLTTKNWDDLCNAHKHIRIHKKHPTISNKCELCGIETDNLDLMNLDHSYLPYEQNPDKWKYVCRSCHLKWDIKYGLTHIPYSNKYKKKRKL